ncbi:Maf family protein [Falsirhodobacter sp. 1013]|uniref:Maf family protein n=1 Tax=Falsirhodobacter sp. 1013 TaxID=3417566 RepID=UPI003EB8BBE8
MTTRLILATSSESRRQMMAKAGLSVDCIPARIDEGSIRASLEAESAKPRDVADTLAEMKARKIAERHPDAVVIGSDQVLLFGGQIYGKPDTPDRARDQLLRLRGQTHQLLSAVVVYENAKPVWRHIDDVRMVMRPFSEAWLDGYLQRNWDSLRHSAGGYKLEEEGVRLFTEVKGDWFTVMGLPLLPLLAWLGNRGFIDG